ncbi:MAG: DUF368 domain-containing protein [Clostridiales bacterium]|nr:DUF368 domain-containing protein [Clostridiales bacterium]
MGHNEKKPRRNPLADWIVKIVFGALVGGGAILPGVSGGVLCVAFGIYRPMMELLSHPLKGFWGLARLTELIFSVSSSAAVSLFAGLVAGTLPHLFRDASGGGVRKSSYVGMTVAAFLMYALLSTFKNGGDVAIVPGIGWYVFCGVVWGLSLVVPGLSSSSILIFLGLYEPMASGIAALRPDVILPLICGIVITAMLSARAVDELFCKFGQFTNYTVLGIVLASTLLIVPTLFESPVEILICAMLFFGGFVGAYFLNKYSGETDN